MSNFWKFLDGHMSDILITVIIVLCIVYGKC